MVGCVRLLKMKVPAADGEDQPLNGADVLPRRAPAEVAIGR
jgi:hypothetical protein